MRLYPVLPCLLLLLFGCGDIGPAQQAPTAAPPSAPTPPPEPTVDYTDPAGPFHGYTSLEDDAEEWSIVGVKTRNVLTIRPGKDGVRTDRPGLDKYELEEAVKWFAFNPSRIPDLADSARNALIILADRTAGDTLWRAEVYARIRAAYEDGWDDKGNMRFGRDYADLPRTRKEEIIAERPLQVYAAGPWIIPPPPPPPPPPVIESVPGG